MKYFLNGTWANDDTITELPTGATPLSAAQWETRQGTPYVPTAAEIKTTTLAEVRSLRAALFPTLAGLQAEALARGNVADAMAIANIQQGARDITGTVLTGAVTKAEIEAKYKAAWLSMLSTAPASVIAAFRALSK